MTYPEIPVYRIPVSAWLDQVSHHYKKQGAHLLQHQINVTQIHHYKCTSGTEHEFLVAEVVRKKEKFLIRIERCRQSACNSTDATDGISAQNRELLALSMSSSPISPDTISRRILADDSAILIDSWPNLSNKLEKGDGSVHLIYILSFAENNRPTLLDLIIVAECTHNYSQNYFLLGKQCFWFAVVVLKVIKNIYRGSLMSTFTKHTHGEHVSNMEAVATANNGGMIRAIRIQNQTPVHELTAIQVTVQTKQTQMNADIGAAARQWETLKNAESMLDTLKRELQQEQEKNQALQRQLAGVASNQ
ncbi:hypothetical protein H0H81_002693 [Sphagnurus paluster]|uniref:Uncharacterized protein n=1 Tax=Sphagnurus paluster TaxID=117069 RepID=A0A9P7KIE1_9AGAR|nr:hypothetical protein H0H81_002693 [Sphagnurus paluster]